MSHIQSPFLDEIPQCKTALRKLRKKIYKYSTTHKQVRRQRDLTHDIFRLLKARNLPSFVADSLKKKRVIDIGSIKNVHVAPVASLHEIVSMAGSQEDEINSLFQ